MLHNSDDGDDAVTCCKNRGIVDQVALDDVVDTLFAKFGHRAVEVLDFRGKTQAHTVDLLAHTVKLSVELVLQRCRHNEAFIADFTLEEFTARFEREALGLKDEISEVVEDKAAQADAYVTDAAIGSL